MRFKSFLNWLVTFNVNIILQRIDYSFKIVCVKCFQILMLLGFLHGTQGKLIRIAVYGIHKYAFHIVVEAAIFS